MSENRRSMPCGCYREGDGDVVGCAEHKGPITVGRTLSKMLAEELGQEHSFDAILNSEFDEVYAGQAIKKMATTIYNNPRPCQCSCNCPGPAAYAVTRDGKDINVCTRCVVEPTRFLIVTEQTDPLPYMAWDLKGARMMSLEMQQEQKKFAGKAN